MPDLEIRQQIARYLNGEVDAAALEDELEDVAWDALDPAESLIATTLRLLAERGNGDWTDDELRGQLAALNQTYWLDQASRQTFPGSEAHVIRQALSG